MAKIRCAVYVRKSTEKGLDQDFNSLDNQEQAARAYIMSQTFQGWEYTRTYSDVAISGGTMSRPGLQELLSDIRNKQIGCVLVYKIDRLSRSIYDFKRMMKKDFEPNDCNLVSITQSFDTSNAMGKLTLNMLLSFAEFEREVASERVRDKMRATKARGMWVGGNPPLGYDIRFGKLVPNESEIPIVQTIFETYLKSMSLSDCVEKLSVAGICGKYWITKHGTIKGGSRIAKSSLQRILTNKIYIGKIPNRTSGEVFDGLHDAILDTELFNAVQQKLSDNNQHGNAPYRLSNALLHNKIMTKSGEVFKNKIGNKGIKKYRYYKTKSISLPMGDMDKIVCDTVRMFLDSDMACVSDSVRLALKQTEFNDRLIDPMVDKIIYDKNKIMLFINVDNLSYLEPFKSDKINTSAVPMTGIYLIDDKKQIVIEQEIYITRNTTVRHRHAGGESVILTRDEQDNTLIRALAYGWRYRKMHESGMSVRTDISRDSGRDHRTIYKYLNLAYLSPRIINAIMSHSVPDNIDLQTLFKIASKYDDFAQQESVFYKS
jgi:DNA invertase Pin-like site-specific DNA recombinase